MGILFSAPVADQQADPTSHAPQPAPKHSRLHDITKRYAKYAVRPTRVKDFPQISLPQRITQVLKLACFGTTTLRDRDRPFVWLYPLRNHLQFVAMRDITC